MGKSCCSRTKPEPTPTKTAALSVAYSTGEPLDLTRLRLPLSLGFGQISDSLFIGSQILPNIAFASVEATKTIQLAFRVVAGTDILAYGQDRIICSVAVSPAGTIAYAYTIATVSVIIPAGLTPVGTVFDANIDTNLAISAGDSLALLVARPPSTTTVIGRVLLRGSILTR